MSRKRISRRDFLKAAGLNVGASTVACCGLSYAASRPSEAPVVDRPRFTYGKEASMNPNILLVAYATRTGSTVGVAAAIAETLAGSGALVEVRPVEEAFFAGLGMVLQDASWLERWMYRAFKIGPEGDCRDWNKIRDWGSGMKARLA